MNWLYLVAAFILFGFSACMCGAFVLLAAYAIDGWLWFRWAALWFALAMFALLPLFHALSRKDRKHG